MPRFEKIKYKRWPIEVTKPVQVIQNKLPEAKAAEITINNNVVVEFGQTTANLLVPGLVLLMHSFLPPPKLCLLLAWYQALIRHGGHWDHDQQ